MKRITMFVTAACAGVGSAASGGEPQIAGTLNFENVTGGRIVQVVGELANNEKEVDFGDFDNDGDLDVVIANAQSDFNQRKNKLYRNDGGTFNEVSGAPLIPGFASADVTRNVFFRDFTGDGWLDIWVTNDGNTPGNPGVDKLYVAQVEDGVVVTFQQINHGGDGGANCGNLNRSSECSGVAADFDDNGTIDVWLGNYPNQSQDFLRFNDGAGNFGLLGGSSPLVPNDCDYTVDVATTDMNGDGTLDLLISNWGNNYLYYNNRNNLGSQDGDFDYTGSKLNLGNASGPENAMEPGDFDGDGDIDVYWTNRSGAGGATDLILRNTGVNGDGTVAFNLIGNLPDAVACRLGTKPTAADLNGDGRVDLFVGGNNTRPVILRNTSVNGVISFIDWTPGDAFPTGSLHRGWHAAVFDSNGDGDLDIFLGGWNDDHLFENVPSNEMTEKEVAGNLPALFNLDPVALVGTAAEGETDVYTASDIGPDSFISIVLHGNDDYLLEVFDSGNNMVGTSDRGGLGIEEALQVETSAQSYTIEVTTQAIAPSRDTDPDDYSVFRGLHDAGDLADVLDADNVDLCHAEFITIFPSEAPVTLDFDGILPNDSPESLEVTFESSANTPSLELTISFWNYNTNSWDIVGTAPHSFNNDAVHTFASVPADHVEAGTGAVQTRYEVRKVGPVITFPFVDCIDQVFWTTSPSTGQYVLEVLARTSPPCP